MLSIYRDILFGPHASVKAVDALGPVSLEDAHVYASRVLSFLWQDYQASRHGHGHMHGTEGKGAAVPSPSSLDECANLVRQLLTIRFPIAPLPDDVLADIDALFAFQSAGISAGPLVAVSDLQPLASLLPSLPEQPFSRLSIHKGDITRLASPTLAIVNPANRAMLGCFQPTHLCADNVVHAAAGPRLRQECSDVMNALELDELDVGEPIVTNGWLLPAGFVLHVAGPQLSRGTYPAEEDKQALARSYEASLDLAEEVGEIDTVAFPCISTGLFAFPSDLAASIALRTVSAWLDAHPTSTVQRAVLVLFSPSDVDHYASALLQTHPSLSLPDNKKLASHFAPPPRVPGHVREWVRDADAVIIHAGAGLSADAVSVKYGLPLDYTSTNVFKELYPALLNSTDMRRLYDSIGYRFQDPLIQWAYILGHGASVTSWGPTPVYTRLHALAASKSSYTILTSNADTLFAQSGGFDPSRIYTPQGSYAYFQCLRPCSPDSFFPSAPWIERALAVFDKATMRIPPDRAGELIPRCERCGGEVFYNVRGGNWFLETPQAGQRERYEAQVKEMVGRARERGKKVVVLELGVGFNTPSVVRWPSERLVEDDGEDGEVVRLIRVNQQRAEVPLELAGTGRAVGLKMGAMEFLQALDLP